MAFRPGDSIAGRYIVEGEIASGGMGVIYAARHLVLDERVAIKCLLPELSSDAEQTARLIGEARAAARIRSEHVARIIDADRLSDGTVFLAMERLDGKDLGALLEEQRRLAIDTAIAYILQASEALAEAHACGIIHRDLKPANLFAARRTDGSICIKVLDFGISKVLSHEAQVRTRTGMFMGTPMYASPEQLTTPGDIDRRTDVWALGCVLYELLAGEPPFVRDTMGALVSAIVSAGFEPLSAKRPDVPHALDAAIARCLEKDRTRRWNDIAELAAALGPFSPAQAAVSLPRIQALVRPSGSLPFAATESGVSIGSGAGSPAATAHAPRAALTTSTVAWAIAAVLAIGVTGATVMRKKAHATPVATDDESAVLGAVPAPSAAVFTPAEGGAPLVLSVPPPAASTSADPTSHAAPPVRSGARRPPASTSSSRKPDDWKMPIKE